MFLSRNILFLLELFGGKEKKNKKKGLQLKDFRYALENGFIEKQKKRIEKKGTEEKGKGEVDHNLRKSQEDSPIIFRSVFSKCFPQVYKQKQILAIRGINYDDGK